VVIHDATLERTFGRREVVAKHAWPALQSLTGARLPSLQQAAAWAAASGAWVNVEIKEAGAEEEVIRILRSHRLMERSFISSFDEGVVARIGELAPESLRFFLTESWNESVHERFTASGAAGLCLRVDAATPLTLDVLRHEGIPVVAWTVDDPDRMRHLLDAGVAGIISNDPAMAVEVRRIATGRV
jgi:glycerophosphoryl diester phosphodiesterase